MKECFEKECCDNCVYHALVSKGTIEKGRLSILCTNVMSKNCGKEFKRSYICDDYKRG